MLFTFSVVMFSFARSYLFSGWSSLLFCVVLFTFFVVLSSFCVVLFSFGLVLFIFGRGLGNFLSLLWSCLLSLLWYCLLFCCVVLFSFSVVVLFSCCVVLLCFRVFLFTFWRGHVYFLCGPV